jgi:hypothetical protein
MDNNNVRTMADKFEEFSYSRKFNPEELRELKEELAGRSIKVKDLKNEAKQVAKQYKEEIKPLEDERSELIDKIKAKTEIVTENCAVMFDHELRVALYYSPSTGDEVYRRPLTGAEMQLSLKLPKTGTEA